MEMQSLKQTYYKDENFVLEVELVFPIAFLHCEVSYWSPSVLRKCYRVFAVIREDLQNNNYEQMVTISPNPKFAKLFGGDTIRSFMMNQQNYEVIQWELK
jgi:hypothetical protein